MLQKSKKAQKTVNGSTLIVSYGSKKTKIVKTLVFTILVFEERMKKIP